MAAGLSLGYYNQQYGLMIGGDGNGYVANEYEEPAGGFQVRRHLMLLRVTSSGAFERIPIQEWTSEYQEFFSMPVWLITNADEGVVVSWRADTGAEPYPKTITSRPVWPDAIAVWGGRLSQTFARYLRFGAVLQLETRPAGPGAQRSWFKLLASLNLSDSPFSAVTTPVSLTARLRALPGLEISNFAIR